MSRFGRPAGETAGRAAVDRPAVARVAPTETAPDRAYLSDMEPVEVLTLVPLATLIVIFGVQPTPLLVLVQETVVSTLQSASAGSAIAIAPEIVIVAIALIVALVIGRIAWVLARGEPGTPGAAPAPTSSPTAAPAGGGGAR